MKVWLLQVLCELVAWDEEAEWSVCGIFSSVSTGKEAAQWTSTNPLEWEGDGDGNHFFADTDFIVDGWRMKVWSLQEIQIDQVQFPKVALGSPR